MRGRENEALFWKSIAHYEQRREAGPRRCMRLFKDDQRTLMVMKLVLPVTGRHSAKMNGDALGKIVGDDVGVRDGLADGGTVSCAVGGTVGTAVGISVAVDGATVGFEDGNSGGALVGTSEVAAEICMISLCTGCATNLPPASVVTTIRSSFALAASAAAATAAMAMLGLNMTVTEKPVASPFGTLADVSDDGLCDGVLGEVESD